VLDAWARERLERGDLDADVFSLVVRRSELVGAADFGNDPRAVEQWGHADAGGSWRQDGREQVLAWVQVDVRTGARRPESPQGRHPRSFPLPLLLDVLDRALRRVGAPTVVEVDACVPLVLAAPVDRARTAVGRDWLVLEGEPPVADGLVIDLDAGLRTRDAAPGVVHRVAELSAGVLRDVAQVAAAPPPAAHPGPQLLRDYGTAPLRLRAQSQAPWSLDLAAWAIELACLACREAGLDGTASIAVRRAAAGQP
jgi:hypothetical protein